MAGSWLDGLKKWFRSEPSVSASFDPISFEKLCLENPQTALAVLKKDQKELADELEQTYSAYGRHLSDLSTRLARMSAEEITDEAHLLRDAQDAIRRMLRRISASVKNAHDLEHELREWEQRKNESGPLHADHPDIRAEIIRSELSARKGSANVRVIAPEYSPFRVLEKNPPVFQAIDEEVGIEDNTEHTLPVHDPNHLVALIRMESREAERWHAVPNPDFEAIEQVRHVRDLHALLRRTDREAGVRRDRTELVLRVK